MFPVYPITEQNIKPYCGNLVCIVTNEGRRFIGTLSRIDSGGRLILNEDPEEAQIAEQQKALKSRKNKRAKAKATAKKAKAHAPGSVDLTLNQRESFPEMPRDAFTPFRAFPQYNSSLGQNSRMSVDLSNVILFLTT